MNGSRYQLLVFDWDGTLMDSEARIVSCIRAATEAMGLEPRSHEAMKNVIGLGLREALEMLFPGRDEAFGQSFVAHYRRHFLVTDSTPSALFEGALEVLMQLAEEGYWLAVATGKGRSGLDRALEETGCASLFHYTRCADETASKPHPRMLLEILDYMGTEAERALMIGDTEYDMEMARNAGTEALAVAYGVHDRLRLMQHVPAGCLDDIRQLPVWLEGSPEPGIVRAIDERMKR